MSQINSKKLSASQIKKIRSLRTRIEKCKTDQKVKKVKLLTELISIYLKIDWGSN